MNAMLPVEILKGFADPTRLRILHLLSNRGPELCVCDLVDTLSLPQGTVSRHLMQLRHQGIVRDRRDGVWMHYSLAEPRSPLHASLLQCLRNCFREEAPLAADLTRFDILKGMDNSNCCPPAAPTAPTPSDLDDNTNSTGAGTR